MFKNDVSYLYSDDCFTSSSSSSSNDKEELDYFEYQPIQIISIRRKTMPILSTSRRSKSSILFNEEALKRDKRREKTRLTTRRLKEKRQLLEKCLHNKISELESEKSYLENHITRLQSHKQDLQNEINNNYSMESIADSLLNDKEKQSLCLDHYSDDFHLFNMSLTNILNLNSDSDESFDN